MNGTRALRMRLASQVMLRGVLEGALAVPEGLTCAIETLTNSPDFDSQRVKTALVKFYSQRGKVTVFERLKDSLSASVDDV
jgi:hypothetical protein